MTSIVCTELRCQNFYSDSSKIHFFAIVGHKKDQSNNTTSSYLWGNRHWICYSWPLLHWQIHRCIIKASWFPIHVMLGLSLRLHFDFWFPARFQTKIQGQVISFIHWFSLDLQGAWWWCNMRGWWDMSRWRDVAWGWDVTRWGNVSVRGHMTAVSTCKV